MILEGFEIENWSCIRRVAVDDLPPTGVVVICGPNGTGKSSIFEALRACVMDNKSTSKAIGRGFPKNSSDRPRVTVSFRVAGTTWRITKRFSSREARLESRTPTGHWKLETDDPTEAHERTRRLAGGCDSNTGLYQLLWLTQTEFHLPEPKDFDGDVQSRLRAVLGVLQTPLDDHFLAKVKAEWSRWFSARNTPGEKPKLKKDCALAKNLAELERQRANLAEIDREYQRYEHMLERSANLEVLSGDLERQVSQRKAAYDLIQEEYQRSLERLTANKLAVEQKKAAELSLEEQEKRRQQRIELEGQLRDAQSTEEAANRAVEEAELRLRNREDLLLAKRRDLQSLLDSGRRLQARLDRANELLQWLSITEQAKAKRDWLQKAEQTANELEESRRLDRERSAPPAATIRKLEQNRAKAAQFQADLRAAAIALFLAPDAGATTPTLAIDGEPAAEVGLSTDGLPISRQVRRRVEMLIPGWGRVELVRGSDAGSLDDLECELSKLDTQFATELAPYGLAASDPLALERLRDRAAEKKLREAAIQRQQRELDRLAPEGLDTLREELGRIENQREAKRSDLGSRAGYDELPQDPAELGRMTTSLKKELELNKSEVKGIETEIDGLRLEIEGDQATGLVGGNQGRDRRQRESTTVGLRQREMAAKEKRAELAATTTALRGQLDRQPTAEQLEDAVREARERVEDARKALDASRLSESEETIRERLDAAKEALKVTGTQLSGTLRELHEIKGAMGQAEGLHQRRSAAAARVEELTRQTERERLESEAHDRLYALFEECREKQLGVLMGPIHDRLMRWMRLLHIGYQSIRFNDQFLPDALIDGATELMLEEESTGTIEQVALMVRLALGSALSSAEEPVVAMLDDPLTHSDVVRVDRMRAVLKDASVGVPGLTPPAGPMQVIVFTCHPEWFASDGATVVDLSRPEVLSRRC
jgi:energy-coupling factor transporter ATP-binding protein EcfA2